MSISQKQKKEKLSTAGAISQEYFFLEDLYLALRRSIYDEVDFHRSIVRQIGFDMFDEIGTSKKNIQTLLSKINSVRKLKQLVIDRDYIVYCGTLPSGHHYRLEKPRMNTEDKLKKIEDYLVELKNRTNELDKIAASKADRSVINDAASRGLELCHWVYKLKQILYPPPVRTCGEEILGSEIDGLSLAFANAKSLEMVRDHAVPNLIKAEKLADRLTTILCRQAILDRAKEFPQTAKQIRETLILKEWSKPRGGPWTADEIRREIAWLWDNGFINVDLSQLIVWIKDYHQDKK